MRIQQAIALSTCLLATALTAQTSKESQQPVPGRPAGTPGYAPPKPPTCCNAAAAPAPCAASAPTSCAKATATASAQSEPRLTFAVVNFQTPGGLTAEGEDLGVTIADAFALRLKELGARRVIRIPTVLSYADLADAKKTRVLKGELGVDVVVGGSLEK